MRLRSYSPLAAVLLAAPLASCGLAKSLSPESTNVPLSLARQLEGTWKTAVPVKLTYQTDFCGAKQAVATSNWNVTWKLTAVQGFSNVLDVEMTYSSTAQTRLASNCGNGSNGWLYIPIYFMRMTVSSSAFTATDTNNGVSVSGSYLTGVMNGTWIHYDCVIYCYGEYSAAQEFKLVKQ